MFYFARFSLFQGFSCQVYHVPCRREIPLLLSCLLFFLLLLLLLLLIFYQLVIPTRHDDPFLSKYSKLFVLLRVFAFPLILCR
jgi:hypothetical protein